MTTLGYELEWYDPQSERVQTLFLRFFIEDGTIELVSIFHLDHIYKMISV